MGLDAQYQTGLDPACQSGDDAAGGTDAARTSKVNLSGDPTMQPAPAVIASLIAASVVITALPGSAEAQDIRYQVTDLGTLGGTLGNAFSINNSGEAVGQADIVAGDLISTNAYRWREGVMLNLGSLNDTNLGSVAVGINDSSEIVGAASAPHPTLPNQFVSRPFFWSEDLGMIDIAPDPSATGQGVATGINRNGEVAGRLGRQSFRWTLDGGSTALPHLATPPAPLQPGSEVEEINVHGEIVGRSTNAQGRFVPVLWSADGAITELAGFRADGTGVARALNDFSVAVGQVSDQAGRIAPTIWRNGVPEIIAFLDDPGRDQGTAEDINNLDVIVGWDASISVPGVPVRGWVRYADGSKIALNDLILDPQGEWDIRLPLGINDVGQIVGVAVRTPPGGAQISAVAFLLDPVPDPDCRHDLSRDGRIDNDDLLVFQGALGSDRADADFNGDGSVDQRDLRSFLLGAAREGCAAATASAATPAGNAARPAGRTADHSLAAGSNTQ